MCTDFLEVDCQLCGGSGHTADGCSIRARSRMDYLEPSRSGEWAPSSDKVLGDTAGLPRPAPPATAPLVPALPAPVPAAPAASPVPVGSPPAAAASPTARPVPTGPPVARSPAASAGPPASQSSGSRPAARPAAPPISRFDPPAPSGLAGKPDGRPAGFGPPRRTGVPLGPPARPPALTRADIEALQRLDPRVDPEPPPGAKRTPVRPAPATTPAVAPPEPVEPAAAGSAPPVGPAKTTVRKSLLEVLAELEGRDIRLPPPPSATPPRRPAFAPRPVTSPGAAPGRTGTANPGLGLGLGQGQSHQDPPAAPLRAPGPPPAPLRAPGPAIAARIQAIPPGTAGSSVAAAGGPTGIARPTPETGPAARGPAAPVGPAGSSALPPGALIGLLADLRSGPAGRDDDPPVPSDSEADGDRAVPTDHPTPPGPKGSTAKVPRPISTWPPPGAVAATRPLEVKGKGVGPLKSAHRADPRRQKRLARLRAVFSVLLIAGAAAGLWYAKFRPGEAAPATWDPRVAPLAAFVRAHTGLTWVKPVAVRFEPPASWPNGTGSVTAGAGAGLARWVPADATLYVDGSNTPGSVPDVYTDLAIVGQLTLAVRSEHQPDPAASARAMAVEVQRAYVRSLSPAGRAELAREEGDGR